MDTSAEPRKTRIIFSYGKMREIPLEGVAVRKKKTKKDILNDLLSEQVNVLEFSDDLDVQSGEVLQNLYQYFQAEKEAGDVLLPTRSASERCSLATNVANRTYRHIVAKERRRKAAAAVGGGKKRSKNNDDDEEEEETDYEAADDDDEEEDDDDDKSSTSSIDLPPDQRIDFEEKRESSFAVRDEKVEPSTMRVTRSRSKSPLKSTKKRESECE